MRTWCESGALSNGMFCLRRKAIWRHRGTVVEHVFERKQSNDSVVKAGSRVSEGQKLPIGFTQTVIYPPMSGTYVISMENKTGI